MLFATVVDAYILQSADNCHVDGPLWLFFRIHKTPGKATKFEIPCAEAKTQTPASSSSNA
jgi:hypothetical protein